MHNVSRPVNRERKSSKRVVYLRANGKDPNSAKRYCLTTSEIRVRAHCFEEGPFRGGPRRSTPKRFQPGIRQLQDCRKDTNELFDAEWDLLVCSAGSLSAVICEMVRQQSRAAIDVGSIDATMSRLAGK